ncbi:Cytochrome c oxidase subunit 1-beta [Gemmata obscuriglobus]|uniref:Cytochrome c oxidase subunit I n=1 Tax=Gemmata obscuriglobus TaxID=114 RepID=A0A2Z3GX95_9BACT|nr:cbb3-type cytochrome c oxidase subunit I [Gemmata obscuriglobus]AWM36127.1 cytochrome c oxidase subunit I [Gemmata obscuriglobus]QEG31284.1 Cytochrome c oxidase subunit 1-beta [Gemmata obscuriglobus]VTS10623.1 cytochrome c oxidase subunit i : Cytochrome c oxidase, subunit I OS=Oscillochloris trichoides DG-6 GN=OSCT_2598 PE=3 SV=1: COX1 [Gemmata obscuriglobus UQM 2246]
MSTVVTHRGPAAAPVPPEPAEQPVNYLNVSHTIWSWLFTVDHKRIGILYLISISVFFALGGFFAALIRANLVTPTGAIMTEDAYNRAFTAHGVLMLFFFLIPAVPAVMGNFFIPLMVGAKDLAFPKLNIASWYVFMIGATCSAWAVLAGGIDTGWTLYPPYSTRAAQSVVIPGVMGAFISGFSSIMTGLNVMVTVHKMRAPGLTWGRLPLFVWSLYATSLIQLLATPVVAISLVLLMVERAWGIGIFDPSIGGDPLLFQHLFWFYSHPAVYIMILPGMGVVSEILTCFSRKNIFGYHAVAWSSMGIAVVGFLLWAHHMFVAGISFYAALLFSLLSMLVAVPSAIKVFNWVATLYRGSITFHAPMLLSIGFLVLFTIGGLTGLFLATLGTDIHLHDTYFVVAHFHFVMVGGMVLAYMAAVHFWWPKMTGRMYSDWWSRVASIIIIVGFFLTFIPQFVMGYHGMPRRYPNYPAEFQFYHVMSTAGSSILGLGYLLPAIYLPLSLFFGKKAGANPWSATGLEWQTQSPPTVHNFDATPVVVCGPYEYAIGVDQMGRGLPEPPGSIDDPAHRSGTTGPEGPMKKETEVVG